MGKKKTINMDQSKDKSSVFDMPEEFDLIDKKIPETITDTSEEKNNKKTENKKNKKHQKKSRSKRYLKLKTKIDKTKFYSPENAIDTILKLSNTKFDSSLELNLVTKKPKISGSLKLPYDNGKSKNIAVFSEPIEKKIESKNIDFDLLVAKPQDMSKIAKYAKFLGPKGLMPNPKNNTISNNPEKTKKELESKVLYKTEKNAPLIHLVVGKKSLGKEKLLKNLISIIKSVNAKQIKKANLSSSMSPGINLDLSSF